MIVVAADPNGPGQLAPDSRSIWATRAPDIPRISPTSPVENPSRRRSADAWRVPSHAQPSATRRRPWAAVRRHGGDSPLLIRANSIRNFPAAMCHRWPARPIASSDRVRGDRPDSAAWRIAGQASRVDMKVPMTRVDGIRRSSYAIAPSSRTSVFSPRLTARRPTSALLQSRWRVSGRTFSSTARSPRSLLFVFTAFALRGAPCGDDARPGAAFGRYHEQQLARRQRTEHPEALLVERCARSGNPRASGCRIAASAFSNEMPCSATLSRLFSGSQSYSDIVRR